MVAVVAILFHSGAYTAVFVNFQLQKGFIVSKLCENRFTPEKKCEGKCYLKKQLTKQSGSPRHSSLLSVQQNLCWVYDVVVLKTDLPITAEKESPAAFYQSLVTQHSTAPQPHPPCQA